MAACVRMSGSCDNAFLDKGIEKAEIAKFIRKLKNKTGGRDGLVSELLKYGGSGMVCLLEQLFSVVWQEEAVPIQRSGTHGLNEELSRHRGREGKSECVLCGAECESVVHGGVFNL